MSKQTKKILRSFAADFTKSLLETTAKDQLSSTDLRARPRMRKTYKRGPLKTSPERTRQRIDSIQTPSRQVRARLRDRMLQKMVPIEFAEQPRYSQKSDDSVKMHHGGSLSRRRRSHRR